MYEIGQFEIEAVAEVINSKKFMRYRGGEGGYADRFEKALSAEFKINHVLSVNSGTSALICALVALQIGPGDEVIVPAYTWVATAMAVLAVGAVPVLADIDETLTIDPLDIERKITPYTKAVIPVHMLNMPCDMDSIMEIARSHNLLVCEDACQCCGITYKGKKVGTIGDIGALSFNQFKNISCGEGGAVLTNNDRYYERALMYHDAGCFTREHASSMNEPFFFGVNYRISEIQGAILGEQLKRLDGIVESLMKRRKAMREALKNIQSFDIAPHNDESHAASLCILFPGKDEAKKFCEKYGFGRIIQSGRHIYTNWDPLLEKRAFHSEMNPFKWAHREIRYDKDTCSKTLDIVSRAVNLTSCSDKLIETISNSEA